jgi:hypothetical protein
MSAKNMTRDLLTVCGSQDVQQRLTRLTCSIHRLNSMVESENLLLAVADCNALKHRAGVYTCGAPQSATEWSTAVATS